MNASATDLQLKLGSSFPSAAPLYIMEKLQSVEITRSDNSMAGFQLVFHADRTKGLSQDFHLLSSPLLKPSTRVLISVTMNNHSTVLMDGFITAQELGHSREFGASTLTVTGSDVSVMMSLIEISLEYPQMGDGAIAAVVLEKYSAFGLESKVIPTPTDLIPLSENRTPQQNGTDLSYLKELAANYGYIFYIEPGSTPLTNRAFFGPPSKTGKPQKTLSMDLGPETNVDSINFKFNDLAPTLVDGFVQSRLLDEQVPLTTATGRMPPHLAKEPALDFFKIMQRRKLFTDPGFDIPKAYVDMQSITDQSTDRVVVADGELETLRYGQILKAPGLVAIRGAGGSNDGLYYVQEVTHKIQRGSYRQAFTLTREGLGSTISRTP